MLFVLQVKRRCFVAEFRRAQQECCRWSQTGVDSECHSDNVESFWINQLHSSLETASQWMSRGVWGPVSLGGGGLFASEGFEKGHHALPYVAATALWVSRRHGNAATAAIVEVGCEGREDSSVHRICPFDLWGVDAPWFTPGRWSLSHQTLLVLDLIKRRGAQFMAFPSNNWAFRACRRLCRLLCIQVCPSPYRQPAQPLTDSLHLVRTKTRDIRNAACRHPRL